MKRLSFVLPDFTGRIWVSEAARIAWEPRIQQIAVAWEQVERWSVVEKIRRAALLPISPEALPTYTSWAAEHGLVVLPLTQVGAGAQYSSTSSPVVSGQPWTYRTALLHPDDAAEWSTAWSAGDDSTLGKLLGYPECCREFFKRVWVDTQHVDTTWEAAINSADPKDNEVQIDEDSPWEANILLRWLGVRAVPHLPCSFGCAQTVVFARRLSALACRHGFCAPMATVKEMLQWPVEWDALHGIAEIRTPVVKLKTRTDAPPDRYVVWRAGKTYPAEGATGTRFPYASNTGVQLTDTRSYKSAFKTPEEKRVDPSLWKDNGFTNQAAMDTAHRAILAAVDAAGVADGGYVLDLGCGNGACINKIADLVGKHTTPAGVDNDVGRLRKAHAARSDGVWYPDDIFDVTWAEHPYRLALLMPGRLTEVPPERTEQLILALQTQVERLICYAYADWLDDGGLAGLLARTNLAVDIVKTVPRIDGVEAALVEWRKTDCCS